MGVLRANLWFIYFAMVLAKVRSDNVTVVSSVMVVNPNEPTNSTEERDQKMVDMEMHKIVQPFAESSSPNVQRAVVPVARNVSNTKVKDSTDFRPSPQLDNFYEYNRVPVKPAVPEAKQFPSNTISLNEVPPGRTRTSGWFNQNHHHHQHHQEKPIRAETGPWLEVPANVPPPSYQNSWSSPSSNNNKLAFPSGPGTQQKGGNGGKYNQNEIPSAQRPYVQGSKHEDVSLSESNSYLESSTFGGNSALQKTHFEQSYPVATISEPSIFPWKKIIKFLTTIIPIGLFLSALTPTVINVSATNSTLAQARGRAEEQEVDTKDKLVASLNFIERLNSAECEERVICEILIGAGSAQTAEQYLNNLLNTVLKHENDSVKQVLELNYILEAVKRGNCSSIECGDVDDTRYDRKSRLED